MDACTCSEDGDASNLGRHDCAEIWGRCCTGRRVSCRRIARPPIPRSGVGITGALPLPSPNLGVTWGGEWVFTSAAESTYLKRGSVSTRHASPIGTLIDRDCQLGFLLLFKYNRFWHFC